MATHRIASGRTQPGATAWQQYNPPANTGIYVDVDTSIARFSATPVYITSLGGVGSHWNTTGATSIYAATSTGFRIYVRWANGNVLTPEQANGYQWHINWVGMET